MTHPIRDPRFIAVLILLANAAGVAAQQLTLKRVPPNISWAGCPVAGAATGDITTDARQESARLAEDATQAALLGDKSAALDLLTRAAALDPTSPTIAYHQARILDELDRQEDALAAYCRYLALAPNAPDAEDVRERTRVLGSVSGFTVPAAAAQAYQTGIQHHDAQRLNEAELEFARASEAAPDWSDALYNRAVIRLALGKSDDAASDLRRFLELKPASADSMQVLAVLATLRSTTLPAAQLNARAALIGGLLVPGLGQITTRRTGMGILVLGVASGALMTGVLNTKLEVECLARPVNGECPAGQIEHQQKSRPYLLPAVAVALGTAVFGAIDAYRGANARNARAAAEARVGQDGRPPGLSLAPPSFNLGMQRAQFDLIRIRF